MPLSALSSPRTWPRGGLVVGVLAQLILAAAILALGFSLASRIVWVGRKQGPSYRDERFNAWNGPKAYRVTQPADTRKQWRPIERRRRVP